MLRDVTMILLLCVPSVRINDIHYLFYNIRRIRAFSKKIINIQFKWQIIGVIIIIAIQQHVAVYKGNNVMGTCAP